VIDSRCVRRRIRCPSPERPGLLSGDGAILETDAAIICLGSPNRSDGSLDTTSLRPVAIWIWVALNKYPRHIGVIEGSGAEVLAIEGEIHKIEEKALQKLRHTSRSRMLDEFLENSVVRD